MAGLSCSVVFPIGMSGAVDGRKSISKTYAGGRERDARGRFGQADGAAGGSEGPRPMGAEGAGRKSKCQVKNEKQ